MQEFSDATKIKTTLGNLGSRDSKAEFVEECKIEINKDLDLTMNNSLPRLPVRSVENIFAQAERALRKFVYGVLSESDSKWHKTRLPSGAWERLKPRDGENLEKSWEKADMSLCMQVIDMNYNWENYFKNRLVKQGMYDSKEDLMSQLAVIKRARDPKQHLREQERRLEAAAKLLAEKLIDGLNLA